MKTYPVTLQKFIDNPEEFDIQQNPETEQLIVDAQACMNDRPIVILQREGVIAQAIYKRPGIEKKVREAFLKLNCFIDMPRQSQFDPSIHSFTLATEAQPAPCSKHADDLTQLLETCKKVGLVRELYLEVVSHLDDYLAVKAEFLTAPSTVLHGVGLSECACYSGAYNRFTSNRRAVLENALVQYITKAKPDKEGVLQLLSLGCGDLLEEWVLLGRLVMEGYSNFQIVLVDPKLSVKYAHPSALQPFVDFFKHLDGVKLSLLPFDSIDEADGELKKQGFQADAVLAIDYDEFGSASSSKRSVLKAREDLCTSFQYLQPNGVLLLGSGQNDLSISQQGVTSLFQDSQVASMCEDILMGQVDGEKQATIAILDGLDVVAYQAIAQLQKQGITSLQVSLFRGDSVEEVVLPQCSVVQKMLALFYPSMKIEYTVREASAKDLFKEMQDNGQFDFILSCPVAKPLLKDLKLHPTQNRHTAGSATTVYQFSAKELQIVRIERVYQDSTSTCCIS